MAEEEHSAHSSTLHHTSNSHSEAKPGSKAGGNVLTHKLGPLPVWGWFAVGLTMYILYKHFKGSSSNANAATTPAGTLINPDGSLAGSGGAGITGSTGTTTPVSTTPGLDWITQAYQALQNLGYDNGTISDALSKYAAGQPLTPSEFGIVESAFNLIGAAPSQLGNPIAAPVNPAGGAGTGTGGGGVSAPAAPTSAGPGAGPPNLPASLVQLMTAGGEHIVDTEYNPVFNEWTYLTNLGGIYTLNPNGTNNSTGFFGSIFSTPNANWKVGQTQIRTAQNLRINSNGGYTVVDTAGESYNFGPQSAAA